MKNRLFFKVSSVFSLLLPVVASVYGPVSAHAADEVTQQSLAPALTPISANGASDESGIKRDQAIKLAETHLALRNVRWGAPTGVEDEPDRYVVSYDTPEIELRLLGARRVSVQKTSGLVRVRERR